MPLFNRIKQSASIDANGDIVPGAALPGFLALPPNLWTYDGQSSSVQGVYQYLLEDASGNWELGWVTVPANNEPGVRSWIDARPAGFAPGTTDLTFSMVAMASNAIGCDPYSGVASAGGTSIAVGGFAKVPPSINAAAAVGTGAYVAKPNGTALGSGAVAYQHGEVALTTGNRVFPCYWSGTATESGTGMLFNNGEAVDFGTYDSLNSSRRAGLLRVRGTLYIRFDTERTVANTAAVTLDYMVFVDPAIDDATTLGTPTITAVHSGASAPAVTITIDATTGAPVVTTAEVSQVAVDGVLELVEFFTYQGSDSGEFTPASAPSEV